MIIGGQHFKDFILFYVCLPACLYECHAPVHTQEADTLELGYRQLRAKPGSSARASALNDHAIPPDLSSPAPWYGHVEHHLMPLDFFWLTLFFCWKVTGHSYSFTISDFLFLRTLSVWVLPSLAMLYPLPRCLGGRVSQVFLNLWFYFGIS